MAWSTSDILALNPKFHTLGADVPHSHGLTQEVLEFIEERAAPGAVTVETGAGVSTVLFAARGCKHTTIVPDTEQVVRIRSFCNENHISLENVNFVTRPSQEALVGIRLTDVDIFLIDGSHSFPAAFFDLFYASKMLKTNGLIIIDNTNIWTGDIMKRFLMSEPEWRLEKRFPCSVSFSKQSEFDFDKDWTEQQLVFRRSIHLLLLAKVYRFLYHLRRFEIGLIIRKFVRFSWTRLY